MLIRQSGVRGPMRGLPFLIVCALLAGCAGGDEQGPDATSPGVGATPTGPASASATASTVHLEHDHTSGEAETLTFMINTTGPYTVVTGFRAPEGAVACTSIDARIVVKDPSGNVYEDVSGSNVAAPCTTGGVRHEGATLDVGEWTVEFTGRGAILGAVDIVPT